MGTYDLLLWPLPDYQSPMLGKDIRPRLHYRCCIVIAIESAYHSGVTDKKKEWELTKTLPVDMSSCTTLNSGPDVLTKRDQEAIELKHDTARNERLLMSALIIKDQ